MNKHFTGPGTRLRGPRLVMDGDKVVARTKTLTEARRVRLAGQRIVIDPEGSHIAPLRP